MDKGYSIGDQQGVHFLTLSIIGCVDLFTRSIYADILLEVFRFCHQHKGLDIHGWCLMPSHVHLICTCRGDARLSDTMRDLKKYSSVKILEALRDHALPESRREWILALFSSAGESNPNNTHFQVWQQGIHPVYLYQEAMFVQKLSYLHEIPVEAGVVCEPWHYRYSSAKDYMTKGSGLLPISFVR